MYWVAEDDCVAVAQRIEGAASQGVNLLPVLLQLVGVQSRGQGAERVVEGQLGELVMVAEAQWRLDGRHRVRLGPDGAQPSPPACR